MSSSTPMCFGAVLKRPKPRSSGSEPPEGTTTMCNLSGLKRFMGPQMFRRKRKTGNLNRRRNIEDINTRMDSLSNNGTDVSAERSGHGFTGQVPAELLDNESDRTGSLSSRGEHEGVDGDFTATKSSAGILEPASIFVDNGETPRFKKNEGAEHIQVYRSTRREERTSGARYVVRCIAAGTARLSGRRECSASTKEAVRPSSMEMGVSSSTQPIRKQELAVSEGESKVQKQPKGALPLNDDDIVEPNFTKPLERRQRGGVSSSGADGLRGHTRTRNEHEVRKLEQNKWDAYDSDEAVYYRLDRARTKSATLLDSGYQNLPAAYPIECRAYENVDGTLCATARDCCVDEKVTIVGSVLHYIEVKVSVPSPPVKTLTVSKHTNYTDIDVLRTTTLLEMTEQNKTRLSRIKKK